MTRKEAIIFAQYAQTLTEFQGVKEFYAMAVAALREQEERENVWHDAKDNPPQKPGLYYGKKDDTDSMYLCRYSDGVWTLDAYPETRMHVIKWAYYNAFVQEQEERRWIPVEERLPKCGERVLATDGGFVGEFYINKRGQWQRYNVNDSSLLMALDILWWMPMPEPPKEDA